jgi:hypothetical protein
MTHAQACASLSGELSRNFGALTLTESYRIQAREATAVGGCERDPR